MKKIFLVFAFAAFACSGIAQTLFTYGSNAVDKNEFIRAYNKNKTPVADKEKALREYLDLYVKFKLKVRAGLDQKLDTLPQLLYDAQSFRAQIADSYLNNEKALNGLLDEAFMRSQKDLHVLHFFVPMDANMQPQDTIKAFKSASALYNSLTAGRTDYAQLVAAEPIPCRNSDLGFITAFTLPYEYETLIYDLKNGQTSKPYRTKNGWHLFKLIGERKAVGKWKIAQILISVPPDATEADKLVFKKKADSVYNLLMKGDDFGKTARLVSDDKVTYGNNGELPEFGTGKYEMDFENEAFKLSKNGEISEPFLTSFGYHILKLLTHTPVIIDRNDPGIQFDLKQKVQQDSRINTARDLFVKDVLSQVSYKKNNSVRDADLFRYADSALSNLNSETSNTTVFPVSNKTICTFAKSKLTGKDWLDFIRSYKGNGELYQGENSEELLSKFINNSIVDYYKTHLEDFNPDFRYQMEEFKDGNVLFEIMERNIWGRAANDTEGLQKHYTENKNKYLWAASADILLFNCTNKTVAEEARAALKNGADWKEIMRASNNNIIADSGRFELSQLPVVIDAGTPVGFISQVTTSTIDDNTSFLKIVRKYDAGLQRSFEEARGLVINDHQIVLEDNWIAELKKKYPVKINESVFQSLLK